MRIPEWEISELKKRFSDREVFDFEELGRFYFEYGKDISLSSLNVRVFYLVKGGVIQRVGRGLFRVGEVSRYIPEPSRSLKLLHGKLKQEFPFTDICLWSTEWLHPWMLHFPGQNRIMVEPEKEAVEGIFYFLRDIRKNVFLDPDMEVLSRYADFGRDLIVVKPLRSQAPVQEVKGVTVPELEKIIVDLVADFEIYSPFQGRDLEEIFETVFEKYTLNQSRILRYAGRRNRRPEIQEIIQPFF